MYPAFFGIAEKPFAITPDPRYLYLSARHAEALAHLVYGINEAGGFIQLTGEVGTGKTTTIRSLLARAPGNAEIALIINPRLSPLDFLQTICEELGIGAAGQRARQQQGADRSTQSLPAARPRRWSARGADRRRGAEPQRRGARAGATADQPRNRIAETAADHPDRAAGTARTAGPQRTAPAGTTRHRALPPRAAVVARKPPAMCVIGCAWPARPARSSRAPRCARSTASAAACRASST